MPCSFIPNNTHRLVRDSSQPEVAELRSFGCDIVVGDALDTSRCLRDADHSNSVTFLEQSNNVTCNSNTATHHAAALA